MWAPVLIGGGLAVLVLARKRKGDAATHAEQDDDMKATDTAQRAWDDVWGTPNEWDKRYPDARPDKVLPVNWDDFDPEFARRLRLAFAEMEGAGFDPYVHEAARTQRRQAWLYGQGRPSYPSTYHAGPVVTWTLNASNHGKYPARAADVISKTTYWGDPAFFKAWGKAVNNAGLRWLGDIGDMPHAELK